MENRLEQVRTIVDNVLLTMEDNEERRCAYVHLYGVAQTAAMLAARRGLDQELASVAGMLHDLYTYRTGIMKLHSHNGAEYARPMLRDMGIFSKKEQELILSAIFYHSEKKLIHSEFDELLKDADALQHHLYNTGLEVIKGERKRLKRICKELKLPVQFDEKAQDVDKQLFVDVTDLGGKREKLAALAEVLARKGVAGEETDEDFHRLIRYWPEKERIFDTFRNNWCAAFVYHCCMEAGFELPIKFPYPVMMRFGGVAAWKQWAELDENRFYHRCEKGFEPQRGDIVIYRDMIKSIGKDESVLDHIGIVICSDAEGIIVAEGNENNSNIAGIVKRTSTEHIDGFVRIPEEYEYVRSKYCFHI